MRSRIVQITLATLAGAYVGVAFAMRAIDDTITGAGGNTRHDR